jgi:hypothetical protein
MTKEYDEKIDNLGMTHDETIEYIRMEHREKKAELDKKWRALEILQNIEKEKKTKCEAEKNKAY